MTSYALPHRHLLPAGIIARRRPQSCSLSRLQSAPICRALQVLVLGLASALSATPASAGPAVIVDGQLLEVEQNEAGWDLRTSDLETLAPVASTALPLAANAEVHVQQLLPTHSGWLLSATARKSGSSRLVLMQGGPDGVQQLPVPSTSERMLLQPTVLAAKNAPAALVWIEGASARESSVRAARWSGAGWSVSEEISPQGPGTQIALDAIRLSDGSLLAVWSAYDGTDDEILWSRAGGDLDRWSTPLAISSNKVPDVTPALTLVEGGALVAWSGYDGNDYRVWVSRFNGESWSAARRHGERGSVFPSFAPQIDERAVLVYKQTAPAAWRVSRLGGDGSPERTLSLQAAVERPLVTLADDSGVTLRKAATAEKAPAARRVAWSP